MYIKEKRILVTLITTILIFGFYSLYVYQKHIAGNMEIINDLQFWGKMFMIMIPVTIVAHIIVQIFFSIINKIATNEEEPTITDERDKLIELKAIRASHWTFVFGFILAMGSQALGMQVWVMFVTLLSSGLVSTILEESIKIYLYRRGF